jgi:hypothetical protein
MDLEKVQLSPSDRHVIGPVIRDFSARLVIATFARAWPRLGRRRPDRTDVVVKVDVTLRRSELKHVGGHAAIVASNLTTLNSFSWLRAKHAAKYRMLPAALGPSGEFWRGMAKRKYL